MLYEVVASYANKHGWQRPTWTQEMLIETMAGKDGREDWCGGDESGVAGHCQPRHRQIQSRRRLSLVQGRKNPPLERHWRMLKNLSTAEVADYEDEVDIRRRIQNSSCQVPAIPCRRRFSLAK